MPRRGRKKQLEALKWKLDRFLLTPFIAQMRCTDLRSFNFLHKFCCALLFILHTIGITVFLHGRSHTYVVSMMGLPLGANGILTIPYINLASQNLNAAFFSFQKKFCWVSLTSNHDKLSAFIQGVFLTGTPPKNCKCKKVNLGQVRCIQADLRRHRFT